MNFYEKPYKIYITIDSENRVTGVNSDAFLTDLTDWIYIDEGYGVAYHHAQNNYFILPIMDERYIYNYKFIDGQVLERSQEEKDADYVEPIIPTNPTADLENRVTELENQLAQYENAYIQGVNEA